MPLNYIPVTPAAVALVEELTTHVAVQEALTTPVRRGEAGRKLLRGAVGAVVGGVLRAWTQTIPSYRKLQAASFTGQPIGRRAFEAATTALRGLRLLGVAEGITKPPIDWEEGVRSWSGAVTRYWPTLDLLDMATLHGVTAATVNADFRSQPSTKAPPLPPEPVLVRRVTSRQYDPAARDVGKDLLPISALGHNAERLIREVQSFNAFAAEQAVEGCLPPRWKRVFQACDALHGRWYALGGSADRPYQSMPKAQRRADIRINGEPVAEIDIQASHLSIMHGLLGLKLPEGDPYEVPEVPRDIVKKWILASLGNGVGVTSWPKRQLKNASPEEAELFRSFDASAVKAVVCAKYPFLSTPAQAVAVPAGLTKLSHLGSPERLLALRLQGIEARALTTVMMLLKNWSQAPGPALALSMFDGIIVAQSAVQNAQMLIRGSFGYHAGIEVRTTVGLPTTA